jgi:hypothetical protein
VSGSGGALLGPVFLWWGGADEYNINDEQRRKGRTKNLPFSVSRRCLSTALCVARRSAVFARRLGLRFIALAVLFTLLFAALVGCAVAAAPPEDDVGDCVSLLLLLP